ncbi:MAG: hypothetical protein AAF203_02800 [Pseudomonadota bacterium]
MSKKSLLVNAILLIGMAATAASVPVTVTTQVSRSKGEICELSQDMLIGGGEDYTDKDRKLVQTLCSYDAHSDPASDVSGTQKAVAICPKLNSTFPGLEFIKIPNGETRADVEAKCNRKAGAKNKGKKLAKFKFSVTCANSSSIVGYYHVSRALGIKYVPPAVVRTVDYEFHKSVAKKAKGFVGSDSQAISKIWRRLSDSQLPAKPSAFVDGDFTYGVLSVNPRGEQKTYDGIWLGGANQPARLKNFMTSARSTYQNLKIRKPITSIVSTDLTSANYTKLQQMKDVSDMIILDTIFGQKDRFANTHSVYTWLVTNGDGTVEKLSLKSVEKMMEADAATDVTGAAKSLLDRFEKAKDMPKDWQKEIRSRLTKLRGIVEPYLSSKGYEHAFGENLMLKDNDCGLKDSNPFKKASVINGVYHVSPETFDQLMKLDEAVASGSMDDFLSDNLLMNSADMAKFKSGLSYVADNLRDKDAAGTLYKDLVVKSHFVPKPRPKTTDGFPIYDIIESKWNVRRTTLAGGVSPKTLDDTEVIVIGGNKVNSGMIDQVAVLKFLKVGKYNFVEARVIKSDVLAEGTVVYFSQSAVR